MPAKSAPIGFTACPFGAVGPTDMGVECESPLCAPRRLLILSWAGIPEAAGAAEELFAMFASAARMADVSCCGGTTARDWLVSGCCPKMVCPGAGEPSGVVEIMSTIDNTVST